MNNKPIKRNNSLIPFSKEHHHSLLLCWKIRTGFTKEIEIDRIKLYVDWFYKNHIKPHFTLEEQHLFPILGNNHKLIKKALSQHRRLTRLFNDKDNILRSLNNIEEELQQHIRFEERILFNEIQKVASTAQFKIISQMHQDGKFKENDTDEFWL